MTNTGSAHYNHFQAERINTIIAKSNIVSLSPNQSGSIIFLDPASVADNTNITISLPPLGTDTRGDNTGLHFKFIVKSISTTNDTIIQSINTNFQVTDLIYGSGDVNSSLIGTGETLRNKITLNKNTYSRGDILDCVSDGSNWFFNWNIKSSGGISLTPT